MPSVRECFESLPQRFKAEKASGFQACVHFHLDGETPAWTVAIEGGQVSVQEGHQGEATCTVRTTEASYLELESGALSPEMAFMFGQVKISNPPQMLRYSKLFQRHGA